MVEIRREEDKKYKFKFVKKVLDTLPDWFSDGEANLSYAKSSRDMDTYIISDQESDLGFLIIKETSDKSIEIYCLGLYPSYRNKGLGKILVNEVLTLYKESFDIVQVKTLDYGLARYYDETICFYKSLGFIKLETIKEIWGESNPCMIMVKSL